MFRRDKDSKDTKLDNEGLRRMREAIRQRIEQEEGEPTEETTEAAPSSPYRTTLPNVTTEGYNPPPSSYEPLSRESSSGRDTEYSFLGTSRQERRATPAVPALPDRTERQERTEDATWEPAEPVETLPAMTTVAVDTAWRGTLSSSGPIRIEGAFEGEIITEGELQIAPEAKVEATIRATSIIVAGQLNGQVNCRERLEILASGRVTGQIDAGGFIVHEGAFLGGQVRMRPQGEKATPGEENRPVLQRVR